MEFFNHKKYNKKQTEVRPTVGWKVQVLVGLYSQKVIKKHFTLSEVSKMNF